MKNMKNLKFTNELRGVGSKLKWFLFTQMQDLKLTSEYIDSICPEAGGKIKKNSNPVENLEKAVRQSLIREFSPRISQSKSFEFLVDTVMHNIQKKSLQGGSKKQSDLNLD